MKYKVEISLRTEKELKTLHPNMALRVGRRLLTLGENPRPSQSKKLKNSSFYRLRVGDYRVIYEIIEEKFKIKILSIGHRREVYRQWKHQK